MRVCFLGSGGNSPIPMPTCGCRVCVEARERGVPYARNGNSIYLPGLAAMVDAPEQTFGNLAREGVRDLDYLLLTHWHPDHVAGVRVVQARDFVGFDPATEDRLSFYARTAPTVVTTRPVYERTCAITGLDHYAEERAFADLHLLDEDGPLRAAGFEVRSVPYATSGEAVDATAFVVERGDATLLVAADDAKYLDEAALPDGPELAVFECGLFERGPDGDPLWDEAFLEYLVHEPRHDGILDRIDRLDPGLAVLTEIGHSFARSYEDYRALAERPEYDGVRFAYDGLEMEV